MALLARMLTQTWSRNMAKRELCSRNMAMSKVDFEIVVLVSYMLFAVTRPEHSRNKKTGIYI